MEHAADEKFIRMTTEPVERLVARLAAPSIAIMLISAVYNMADTYFVGYLGTSATAAAGVAFPLMAVIQALGFFFGNGTGNYISRALGAQESEKAEQMAATGLVSALIIGAALAVLGLVFLTPLVEFLGATKTILPHARAYIGYILIGMPIMTASIVLNNLLRFQGSAFYGMIGMVSGAVINIGLDPLFIFVFGMGTGGAALATIISQTVSFALLLAGCLRGGNVRIRLRRFTPRLEIYRQILRGGSPSLLRQGLASIAAILLNVAAKTYGVAEASGDAVIAAISIVNRVVMVANSTLLGFGQGFQPVCGFNYGAELYARVKRGFWFCVKIATFGLTACGILAFIAAPGIIRLFRDDPDVIRIGALTLRMQCFTFPLTGWVIMNNMTLQTTGKTGAANLLALSRQGLFLLPLLFALAPWLGVLGIQLCTPIADLCTFFLSLPLGVRLLRGLSKGGVSDAAP